MSDPNKPFFIGFAPAPKALRALLILSSLVLVLLFGAIGWAIGITMADPGDGRFRGDLRRQTVTGVLETMPYPMVHITEGSQALPEGRTILLAGQGKFGMQDRVDGMDGQMVTVSGNILRRGALDMLQLRFGMNGLTGAAGDAPEITREPLGRWKLAGEICDGKCLAGAMRPGTGLAHKACANLCLAGGVSPVFVSSQPVEGSEFLLIGDADGGPAGDWLADHTAIYVSLEGELERRGDLLVLLVDPETIEVLP